MKWLVYAVVLVYMAYRAVYGANVKITNDISIDKHVHGNQSYIQSGTRKAINCKASSRNQRLEWVDPFGKVIKRVPTSRMFTQEHLVSSSGGRIPALQLVFSELLVKDTGVYTCRSGGNSQELPLCVMTPSEIINTPKEVSAELGRSITLTCQANGDPEPELHWVREYEEVEESSKHIINTKYNTQGYESLLTITGLEPDDSGIYVCFAFQHASLHGCENVVTQNVTLQVSYAPIFENANDTKAVYGNNNEVLDLACSASAFPEPTYRWFKSVNDDTLAEFDKKQITFLKDENKAVLQVTASPSTFGKTYKCLASNSLGEAEKYYTLLKIQAPKKPETVMFENSTDSRIDFSISWSKLEFPVEGFIFAYVSTNSAKRKPTEKEWRKAAHIYKEVDDDQVVLAFEVALDNLEEDTSYWVRVKASNSAGQSPWSDPELVTTDVKTEAEELESEDDDEEEDKKEVTDKSDATFYGIFFAGGLAVMAICYMFAMKLV